LFNIASRRFVAFSTSLNAIAAMFTATNTPLQFAAPARAQDEKECAKLNLDLGNLARSSLRQ